MRKVQRIDQHKTPGARVPLHTDMQPFDRRNNALQMAQILIHRQSAFVLRRGQRAVG